MLFRSYPVTKGSRGGSAGGTHPFARSSNVVQKLEERTGKIGWVILWLLGIPLPILLLLYLLMGGH